MFGEPDRREACVIAECKLGCLRKLDVVRTLKEIATNTIRFLIRRDARRLLDEMARMLVATNRLSREEIQSTWAVAPIADSDVQEFRLSLVQAKPQS